MERFYVKGGSVNAVRRALNRAPGGAKVLGRFDRETIECVHTMDTHSFGRHWPILISRMQKAGLTVVARPGAERLTSQESTTPENGSPRAEPEGQNRDQV